MKRGPCLLYGGCAAASSMRGSGFSSALILGYQYSLTCMGVDSAVYPVSFPSRSSGGEMNLRWAGSERFPLVGLALSAATVGVLTILVINQEHDPLPVPIALQPAPAPPVTVRLSPPAQAAPMSRIMTPPQLAPPSPKPLKATTLPRRRGNPVLAPPPVAQVPPTDPALQARSHPPVKPGAPEGGW
jgi:hypothetical protein